MMNTNTPNRSERPASTPDRVNPCEPRDLPIGTSLDFGRFFAPAATQGRRPIPARELRFDRYPEPAIVAEIGDVVEADGAKIAIVGVDFATLAPEPLVQFASGTQVEWSYITARLGRSFHIWRGDDRLV